MGPEQSQGNDGEKHGFGAGRSPANRKDVFSAHIRLPVPAQIPILALQLGIVGRFLLGIGKADCAVHGGCQRGPAGAVTDIQRLLGMSEGPAAAVTDIQGGGGGWRGSVGE
eukprot:gene12800-biopygen18515